MVAQSSETASEKIQARLLSAWRCLHADPERARAEVVAACEQAALIGRDARPFAELVRGFIELRFGAATLAEAHLNAAINGLAARPHFLFSKACRGCVSNCGIQAWRGERLPVAFGRNAFRSRWNEIARPSGLCPSLAGRARQETTAIRGLN